MKTIRGHAAALLAVVLLTGCALADAPVLRFTRLWTYNHAATPGQIGEIPAFDHKTNTLWVAGIAGVDVLDADKGALIKHIDTRTFGTINSVAINDGRAAFAIEAATRTAPGVVVFYDTETRELAAGINQVTVGAGPDMLTFTHDGKKLLVANEATPCTGALPASCRYGARIGTTVPRVFASPADDPAGSVSIIDMATRSVIATAGFAGVPLVGEHVRLNTGMDYEPEYIAVAQDGKTAFVTLQEANAIGVLDLTTNAFTKIIGLGVKDFSVPGNEIDPLNDGIVTFGLHPVKGIYMPDSIATYEWRGDTYLVMANEGDFREDDADRTAAGSKEIGAAAPLANLRVSNTDSSPGKLYAAGGRSMSIRDSNGKLVYDSGSILDRKAHALGIYDDARSRDKGVEPEGIALLAMDGRTYAFVGLERTLKSAVAVFDITEPVKTTFVEMIVTDGDRAPEGLIVYQYRGAHYLAIANEGSGTTGKDANTTLYRIERARP